MKIIKVLLLLLSITILSGCKETAEDIVFDGRDFEYIGVTDDDYLLFRDGNNNLELLYEDDGTLRASYEKYQEEVRSYLLPHDQSDPVLRRHLEEAAKPF